MASSDLGAAWEACLLPRAVCRLRSARQARPGRIPGGNSSGVAGRGAQFQEQDSALEISRLLGGRWQSCLTTLDTDKWTVNAKLN